MKTDKPFFQVEGTVLEATANGFYKIKGLAAKSGKCRHVSCGATSPTYCGYFDAKRQYDALITTGKWYGTVASQATYQYQKTYIDGLKANHILCVKDWCVNSYGARPANLGEPIQCTRLHLEGYTDQELASPSVRPESVAIALRISLKKSSEVERGIALYDLIDDKWFNDQWWTRTGWQSNKLMPHRQTDWPAPKQLALIDQVLKALKENL